eukprot:m.83943 g.83943  ORF g.83943 m.83943 type:complete len:375 (-) comp8322_c0_seq1:231-1355(-)
MLAEKELEKKSAEEQEAARKLKEERERARKEQEAERRRLEDEVKAAEDEKRRIQSTKETAMKERRRRKERAKADEIRRLEDERLEHERERRAREQEAQRAAEELSSILSQQKNRRQLVREEQNRLRLVRIKVDAATRIQRWWRGIRNPGTNSYANAYAAHSRISPSQVDARNAKHGQPRRASKKSTTGKGRSSMSRGGSRTTKAHGPARSSPRMLDSQITGIEQKRRIVAALTIQLWWRKYLSRRPSPKKQRLPVTSGPEYTNRVQRVRVSQVYAQDLQYKKQYIPENGKTPLETAVPLVRRTPSSTAFASAVDTYYLKQLERQLRQETSVVRQPGRATKRRSGTLPHLAHDGKRNSLTRTSSKDDVKLPYIST